MRKKLFLHATVASLVIPLLVAPLFLSLWYRDGGTFWLVVWVLWHIGATFCIFAGSIVFADKENVAIRQGDTITDLGLGSVPLGLHKLWSETFVYNPKPRDLRQSVTLPARDGTTVAAKATLTWKPDRKRLKEFFDDDPEARLPDLLSSHLQQWSKQHLAGELYFGTPPPLDVPGIVATSLTLIDIAPVEGKMNRHIWDNSQLIESVVNEIEDEDKIEAKRAKLIEEYPELSGRITQIIEQRKALLRKRGLRENR